MLPAAMARGCLGFGVMYLIPLVRHGVILADDLAAEINENLVNVCYYMSSVSKICLIYHTQFCICKR
jgi:hypothetical protein